MWTRYLALCAALIVYPPLAGASVNTIFNENGRGSFVEFGPVAQEGALLFRTGPDPSDPTNGLMPLIYSYPPGAEVNMLAGDLLIHNGNGMLTDVVRFFGNDIIFYSLPGGGELADVGLPTTFMSSSVDVTANGRQLIYNPEAFYPNQPGFTGGPSIFAITLSVPEPGTWALLLAGLGGAAAFRRQKAAR